MRIGKTFAAALSLLLSGCATQSHPPAGLNETDVKRVVREALDERFPPRPSADNGAVASDQAVAPDLSGKEALDNYDAYIFGHSPVAHPAPAVGGVQPFRTESPPSRAARSLEIHFIDVGQGDSTLVLCPNGKNILVDAGTLSGADPEPIRDYILERIGPEDPKITTLVVTHPDQDHYNILDKVLNEVPVDRAFYVGAKRDFSVSFWNWFATIPGDHKTLLKANDFDAAGKPNPQIDCSPAKVHVLAADVRSNFSASNTKSIVLLIQYGKFKAILTGDATRVTEAMILNRYDPAWLDVDILKIGHHGSLATSTTENWLAAVKPEVAVASAGWDSVHGHPRKEIFERIEPYAIPWGAHNVRTATGRRSAYEWKDDHAYKKAIFSTATNGTVAALVKPTGEYDVTWFDYGD